MGGLETEPKLKGKGTLEEFALENIKNIRKIIPNVVIEPEDGDKLPKTMEFLGYYGNE